MHAESRQQIPDLPELSQPQLAEFEAFVDTEIHSRLAYSMLIVSCKSEVRWTPMKMPSAVELYERFKRCKQRCSPCQP